MDSAIIFYGIDKGWTPTQLYELLNSSTTTKLLYARYYEKQQKQKYQVEG